MLRSRYGTPVGQCSARYKPTTGEQKEIYVMYNSLAGFRRILLIFIEDVQNVIFSHRS